MEALKLVQHKFQKQPERLKHSHLETTTNLAHIRLKAMAEDKTKTIAMIMEMIVEGRFGKGVTWDGSWHLSKLVTVTMSLFSPLT